MSICLERITKRFGSTVVLDDVSDVVPAGSLTALLGPSGSGKSTLLRVVAGLARPEAGRVVLNGRDVTNLPPRHRRIGFCFQDYAPFTQMTVAQNVAFGLKAQRVGRNERRRRVAELLERVRLTEFAHRYPHQLSGGQRQRMALVRALAVRPEVLLLDEPFAALDAQVRGELRTWLRELHAELGITTIIVTHDQSEAMELADRLVVLHDGAIQQVGRPAAVYDSPANDFVRSFIGPVTTLNGEICRPHDVVVGPPGGRGTDATIVAVVPLGFEVRLEARDDRNRAVRVQLTHREASALKLAIGDRVTLSLANPPPTRPAATVGAVDEADHTGAGRESPGPDDGEPAVGIAHAAAELR